MKTAGFAPLGMPSAVFRRPGLRKLALFRASRIGDFVCATPAFRAIRHALPHAEITLVALPLVADLADRCRSIDRFEPFPGTPGIAEQFFDARKATAFFARMQRERFDLAVQMHGSGVFSNPVTLMLGAAATAGFVREGEPAARLDAAFPVPGHLSEIERLLALAAFLGAPSRGAHTEFGLREEDELAAQALLAGGGRPLVGLHAGAREAVKRWPADRFSAVGNAIAGRGGTVVVVGGPDDAAIVTRLTGQLDVDVRICTNVSLPVLGGVIRRLDVLVSNDSGPAHIAYALNTPTVTVFGGTEPHRWRPMVPGPFRLLAHHVECRPCEAVRCPYDDACLRAVTVDRVIAAARDVMREAGALSVSRRARAGRTPF